jgi:hypothetical protein
MMVESDISFERSRSILVVADDPKLADAAAQAVDFAGSQLSASVSISEAETRLDKYALPDVVIIDLQESDAEHAGDLLVRVDTLVREGLLGAVIAFEPSQIDDVTARVLGPHLALLCRPTPAELVADLIMAGPSRASRAHDQRDTRDERERLQTLNDEVARIAATLARLTQENGIGREAGLNDVPSFGTPAAELEPVKAATVRNAIRARRMRHSFFRHDLFADPAWDMLLDLYAAHLEHVRVSVSSLCIAAAVPGTTALRWIGTMLEEDLFERTADPIDRRRAYISLTPKARDGMHRYFDALQRAGLASA